MRSPVETCAAILQQPSGYMHAQRLQLPPAMDTTAVRAVIDRLLLEELDLPMVSIQTLLACPCASLWVRHWYRLPRIAALLGAYFLMPHLAKGAGWIRLSTPQRRFALFQMGERTPCEAIDRVPMDMRQEALGLSALYSLQTTVPHALAVRMPLLFSPDAQAWQAHLPDVQCPPVLFHMAVQHARFDQART